MSISRKRRPIPRSARSIRNIEKQVVDYHGKRKRRAPSSIDTPNKFLFLVQGDGKALRYGVGVGRPGFTWSGVKTIIRQEGMAGLDAAAGNAGAPS